MIGLATTALPGAAALLATAGLLATAALATVTPPPNAAARWSAWHTMAAVHVPAADRSRLVRLRLPPALDPGPDGSYPDVRLADESGTEVAYAFPPDDAPEAGARAVALVDSGFVPGAYTQAVLDLGDDRSLHDEVELRTSRETYFARVAVDASDDRRTWRRVRDDAIVYRVAQDGGRGSARVPFPPTYSRWLRLRIADPRAPFPLDGATVARADRPQPVLEPLPWAGVPQVDPAGHGQSWSFFGGGIRLRPTAIAFGGGRGTYVRRVLVESSAEGTSWESAGEGTIARYAGGGAQESFAFPQATAPRWRVTVENGNDPPLAGLRPTLLARPRELLFRADPRHGYIVLAGNPRAGAPSYDLPAQLAHDRARADAGATLGPLQANPAYADARPLPERFPGLLTGVLLALAGLMALLTVRTLRASKASAE